MYTAIIFLRKAKFSTRCVSFNTSAPSKDQIDFRRAILYVPKSRVHYVKLRNGDIVYCHVEIPITLVPRCTCWLPSCECQYKCWNFYRTTCSPEEGTLFLYTFILLSLNNTFCILNFALLLKNVVLRIKKLCEKVSKQIFIREQSIKKKNQEWHI